MERKVICASCRQPFTEAHSMTSSAHAVKNSQGPVTIWHWTDFPTLIRLLRKRPRLHWSRLHKMALIPPMSLYHSAMGGIERLLYERQVAQTQITEPPVFIIGHWRSGTTLLHNLMSQDQRFTYPNMYHVCCPGHFLFTERVGSALTGWMLPKHRPMDNLPAGWKIPQEDEIAFCVATLISPYLMLAFSDDRSHYARYYELKDITPAERQQWIDFMMSFMKKLTCREPKPVLLKSPTHTFRIPLLLEMFPDAKFIYIHRNPYAVYPSTRHLRRTLFDDNSLAPVNQDSTESDIFFSYELLLECYERDQKLIPEGHLHEVRFEDLEVDPIGELSRVYSGLSLPGFEDLAATLKPQLPELRRYKKNRFDDLEPGLKRRIYERLSGAFDRYGYDPELEDAPVTVPHLRRARIPA